MSRNGIGSYSSREVAQEQGFKSSFVSLEIHDSDDSLMRSAPSFLRMDARWNSRNPALACPTHSHSELKSTPGKSRSAMPRSMKDGFSTYSCLMRMRMMIG